MICVMLLVAALQHGCTPLPKSPADLQFWSSKIFIQPEL